MNTKFFDSPAVPYAFAALAAAGAIYIVIKALTQPIKDVAGAIGSGASSLAEGIGGVATGHNSLTANTEYADAGLIGTFAAGVDSVAGGLFSSIGDFIGGGIYDLTHSESLTNQGSRADPVANAGRDDTYADAANSSPVNAQYRATPFILN